MSDLTDLQGKLGVKQTDVFDLTTAHALTSYQASHGLPRTGDPDPPSLVTAGIYAPTGKTGSGFLRDLASAGNQVPRAAWIVLGVLGVGLSIWAYKKRNPKGKSKR